jgi:hypothetical protein
VGSRTRLDESLQGIGGDMRGKASIYGIKFTLQLVVKFMSMTYVNIKPSKSTTANIRTRCPFDTHRCI